MSLEYQQNEGDVLDDFYVRRNHFVSMRIKRLKEKIPKLSCSDYHEVDMINWTKAGGLHHFMKTYTPGPKVLEIGGGLGGLCRTMADEYKSEPIGVEYSQVNVDLGNEISRELEMPEFLQWGDASVPMNFENMDAVVAFSVISQVPRTGHEMFMKNTFNALKPGGVALFEDPCFFCTPEEVPEVKSEAFDINAHMKLVFTKEEFLKLCTDSGLEIVEQTDVSEENALGIWNKSEVEYLKVLEELGDQIDEIDTEFNRRFGMFQPKIFADLQAYPSSELRERFPRVCKYTDPDVFVHGTTHNDIRFLRIVLKKPEN